MLEETIRSSSSPSAKSAFSAVLLAGGRSSRMGRDKAGLIVEEKPLWQRQISTLRQLHPRELFISGKPNGPYAGGDVEIVPDITPDRGPLSGLEATLQRSVHPLVLVLAVDLPAITSEFLARLLRSAAGSETGVVPQVAGWFEPLAAVYPRRALPLVQECLRGDDLSMQAFVRQALARNLVAPWDLTPEDAALFRNVNSPVDLNDD